jgi:hypothetical protein
MNFSRMKHILLLIFLVTGLQSFSQITCTISPSDTTIACFNDSIAFIATVEPQGEYTYQWLRNDTVIPGADTSFLIFPAVEARDTANYLCIVTDGVFTDTSNTVRLRMHPKMIIDTLEDATLEKGCRCICNGAIKLVVSGGIPFSYSPPPHYLWKIENSQNCSSCNITVYDSASRTIQGIFGGEHVLKIKDQYCTVQKNFYIDFNRPHKTEINVEPSDTIYLTKPNATLSFPDSSQKFLIYWKWDFGDTTLIENMNPASHNYAKDTKPGEVQVKLSYTDENQCDTTISHTIIIKQVKPKIFNVFTPDNNGINDTFVIKLEDPPDSKQYIDLDLSEIYQSNELQIIDRWGRKVYSKKDYISGEWDGANLSDGAYFYILKCQGYYGEEVYKGSVTILRAH